MFVANELSYPFPMAEKNNKELWRASRSENVMIIILEDSLEKFNELPFKTLQYS